MHRSLNKPRALRWQVRSDVVGDVQDWCQEDSPHDSDIFGQPSCHQTTFMLRLSPYTLHDGGECCATHSEPLEPSYRFRSRHVAQNRRAFHPSPRDVPRPNSPPQAGGHRRGQVPPGGGGSRSRGRRLTRPSAFPQKDSWSFWNRLARNPGIMESFW